MAIFIGEIIVANAKNAQLILTFQEKLSLAVGGALVCTNYRVTFIPDKQVLSKVQHVHRWFYTYIRGAIFIVALYGLVSFTRVFNFNRMVVTRV